MSDQEGPLRWTVPVETGLTDRVNTMNNRIGEMFERLEATEKMLEKIYAWLRTNAGWKGDEHLR